MDKLRVRQGPAHRAASPPEPPPARTVEASSSILREGSAKLSTRHVNDGGCPNESAACGSIANQEVRGSGRCGLHAREDTTDGKSLRFELLPAMFITTPNSVCLSSEPMLELGSINDRSRATSATHQPNLAPADRVARAAIWDEVRIRVTWRCCQSIVSRSESRHP